MSTLIEKLASEITEEIGNLSDVNFERWGWLEEVEREAYITGNPKLLGFVRKALETLEEVQEDIGATSEFIQDLLRPSL